MVIKTYNIGSSNDHTKLEEACLGIWSNVIKIWIEGIVFQQRNAIGRGGRRGIRG